MTVKRAREVWNGGDVERQVLGFGIAVGGGEKRSAGLGDFMGVVGGES